jgi:hypothetical protein
MVCVADASAMDVVYCTGEETGDLRVIAMPQTGAYVASHIGAYQEVSCQAT